MNMMNMDSPPLQRQSISLWIHLLYRGLADILMKMYDAGHLFCSVIMVEVGLNVFTYISSSLKRILPRGIPGCTACCGPSHHACSQGRLLSADAHQSGSVTVSIPCLYIRRFRAGHSEPAAFTAGAQLYIHLPQHRALCGAREGTKAEGVFVGRHVGFHKRDLLMLIIWLFLVFFVAILGVHEDDGPQQLAPLECLVPHVLSLYLNFSLSRHSAPLYLGEFAQF